jgi:hypothetical protein
VLHQADQLSCESWNERMWADGEPIDPSSTIDQAINGGYTWPQIERSPLQDAEGRGHVRASAPADDLRTTWPAACAARSATRPARGRRRARHAMRIEFSYARFRAGYHGAR